MRATHDGGGEVWAKCTCERVMRYPKKSFFETPEGYFPKETSSGSAGSIKCDCGRTFPFITKGREMMPSSEKPPECLKCGSTQLTVYKKGFGLGKAAGGWILLGPVGLLGGLIGSQKLMFTCMKCGHKWQPFEK